MSIDSSSWNRFKLAVPTSLFSAVDRFDEVYPELDSAGPEGLCRYPSRAYPASEREVVICTKKKIDSY